MQNEIYYLIITALLFLVSALLWIILKNKKETTRLLQQLEEERKKLNIPYLNLAIAPSQPTLCLINEGSILTNDISIEDVDTTVDVGFQKKLLFRFEPVRQLKPGETVQLNISIYENGHALPPTIMDQMGGILVATSFTAYVHCRNMEGTDYCIELVKKGPDSKINRIAVVEETA